MSRRAAVVGVALALPLVGCTAEWLAGEQVERFRVEVRRPGGEPLPTPEAPDPVPLDTPAPFVVDLTAERLDGSTAVEFEGWVRLSATPGSLVAVDSPAAVGRSVRLTAGQVLDVGVALRGARGPTRVWVSDIGYQPEDPFLPPACANGLDDDGDTHIDFPEDPGCAFANDGTEEGGNHAAGVSPPLEFALPRLGDVQGRASASPFVEEGVDVGVADPAFVVVTRLTNDGFYATDVTDTRGYGHIFAFTFSTPPGLRICDRLTRFSGTATEFFGFTEVGFPSFERHAWRFPTATSPGDGPCRVPEPVVLDAVAVGDDALMESVESALVRVEFATVGAHFGPGSAAEGIGEAASNCDLNGDGALDFDTPGSREAACADACAADVECVEWSGYASRGNFRVRLAGGGAVQLNARAVAGFDPVAHRGQELRALTGTLRHFSGGDLNWTIEARCSADLVLGAAEPVSSQLACVSKRTEDDPDDVQ